MASPVLYDPHILDDGPLFSSVHRCSSDYLLPGNGVKYLEWCKRTRKWFPPCRVFYDPHILDDGPWFSSGGCGDVMLDEHCSIERRAAKTLIDFVHRQFTV